MEMVESLDVNSMREDELRQRQRSIQVTDSNTIAASYMNIPIYYIEQDLVFDACALEKP